MGGAAGAESLWDACVDVLREEFPEGVCKAWLEKAEPQTLDNRRLVLAVDSPTAKERIESRYLSRVRDVVSAVAGSPHELVFEVRHDQLEFPELSAERVANPETEVIAADRGDTATAPVDVRPATYQTTGLGRTSGSAPEPDLVRLNPAYTFDHFVIGESNRFAAAAALAVAEKPATSYNPLFIYGDAGLGKTHLLHAIGHFIRLTYPERVVRYVSTETFLNDFIESIRTNSQSAFKLRYRRCDVLLVDDVQLIENKEHTQEEFFHTFDFLHSAGRQVVISSDRPPKAMATLEDRLRSRFGWGLITDIQPPGLETRLAILRQKAATETAYAPDDVLGYIAEHITNNIRELEGALNRVLAYSSLNGIPLDLAVAESILGDLVSAKAPRQITAKVVIDATADMFGLSPDELCGKSRSRPLVTARQIAMYVLRETTDFSFPAIGRAFGDRDHTTVMHAVAKIAELMRERRTIYEQVTELTRHVRTGL